MNTALESESDPSTPPVAAEAMTMAAPTSVAEVVQPKPTGASALLGRLLAMAQRSNNLEENPEFFNTLTDNCTNVIAQHVDEVMGRQVPWYRRPLLSGKYERLGYEQGWLLHSLPWQQHRAAALINDRAALFVNYLSAALALAVLVLMVWQPNF